MYDIIRQGKTCLKRNCRSYTILDQRLKIRCSLDGISFLSLYLSSLPIICVAFELGRNQKIGVKKKKKNHLRTYVFSFTSFYICLSLLSTYVFIIYNSFICSFLHSFIHVFSVQLKMCLKTCPFNFVFQMIIIKLSTILMIITAMVTDIIQSLLSSLFLLVINVIIILIIIIIALLLPLPL